MSPESITYSTITELSAALREGTISSEEIVRAYLARLELLNPLLNAVIQIAPESAVDQARAADAAIARGEAIGPLHGIPFTVKDVYPIVDSARLVNAPGMAAPLDLGATREATVVTRLRKAGAIPIGVTRATWWSDREGHYGHAYSPYDRQCEPGGSSGGEAAIIAAGGSPLGIGSDSGGKSSDSRTLLRHRDAQTVERARAPRDRCRRDQRPAYVAGPLARSIADLALVLPIIAGVDALDPTTVPLALGDYQNVRLDELRVGVFVDNGIVAPTTETADAVRRAADTLAAAGAKVHEIAPPGMDEAWEITLDYWRGDAIGGVSDYFAFLDRWDRYRTRLAEVMQTVDVIVCPAEALPAPRHDAVDKPTGCTYTTPFSLVGLPCAVVRAGTSPDGLPIGVQIVGAPWRDDLALAAAACVEATCGGWTQSSLVVSP